MQKRLTKTLRRELVLFADLTRAEHKRLRQSRERKPIRLRANYARQMAALDRRKAAWTVVDGDG